MNAKRSRTTPRTWRSFWSAAVFSAAFLALSASAQGLGPSSYVRLIGGSAFSTNRQGSVWTVLTNGGSFTGNGAGLTNLTWDTPTNVWTINTDFRLGQTNAVLTSAAATGGITGLANKSTSTARYGELSITATGDLIFTNPVSMRASDYLSSRTITNGNTAEIAVKLVPGISTNLSISQFR